jgi:hypothetical protein
MSRSVRTPRSYTGRLASTPGQTSCPMPFEEFEPISERIKDVDTIETFQRLVRHDGEPRCLAPSGERVQTKDEESRMRFLGRSKILIDPEVKPKSASAEPHASASCQILRF